MVTGDNAKREVRDVENNAVFNRYDRNSVGVQDHSIKTETESSKPRPISYTCRLVCDDRSCHTSKVSNHNTGLLAW